MKKRNLLICFFIILSIGISLRIYKLGSASVWFDEAIFLLFSSTSKNFLDFLEIVRNHLIAGKWQMQNPFYTSFASFWGAFINNEFMARLPSAIFGIVSIPAIYYLGKTLFNSKTGLISAFILAISPFHIYYSQELRMYSLITLLTIISVYFFIKFLRSGRYNFLIGYVTFTVLNIYIQAVTVLVLVAEILFFFLYRKRYTTLFKRWLTGQLLIALSLIPELLLTALWLKTHSKAVIWETRISTTSELGHISLNIPFFTFKNFCVGYNATPLIYLPVTALFLILLIRSVIKKEKREEINFCLICLFIPVFIMYIFQAFIYADRYLISSSVFLYLIAANALIQMKKSFIISIIAIIFVSSFFSLRNYYRDYLPGSLEERIAEHSKKEYRQAADYIADNFQYGDFILYIDYNSLPSFEYYFITRGRAISMFGVTAEERKSALKHGIPSFWPVASFSKNTGRLVAKDIFLQNIFGIYRTYSFAEKKRIWLIFSAREFENALKPESSENKIVKWFDSNYKMFGVKTFRGIILYLFIKA